MFWFFSYPVCVSWATFMIKKLIALLMMLLRVVAVFRYLNQSDCWERKDGVYDADDFDDLIKAFEKMGIEAAEVRHVLGTQGACG